MLNITSKEVMFILLGIFSFNLYFDARCKSFLAMSLLLFIAAFLEIFQEVLSKELYVLIYVITIVATGVYIILEGEKFEKRGIVIIHPSKKNYIVGLLLLSISSVQ